VTSTTSEHSTIERELYIEASPELVYEVVSKPEHIARWWSDEAEFEETPGGAGWISFGDVDAGGRRVELSVAEADPPRRFAFRWTNGAGEGAATVGNSNLVTFDLVPEGAGTRVTFIEVGFTERGWDDVHVAEVHADHSSGWDHFLPRLSGYAAELGARR
jgi:uncharacterized protein YndB with AHSA1/START domain